MSLKVPEFDAVRVLVAGDLMLDRYWYGNTARISPEAPVPVVHVRSDAERPGGAGNVGANIVSLGAKATVIGVGGVDAAARSLVAALAALGVDCEMVESPAATTIVKLRVISRHQQLIRLDFEGDLGVVDRAALARAFAARLPEADVVVLSDYAKGTLGDPQALIKAARAAGKPVLVDPKGRDFVKYRGATLLTPNLGEFEAVVGPAHEDEALAVKGEALRAELGLDALLVTRSERGMSLIRASTAPLHLPAQAIEVFDVTGAGDTVIGVLAAALGAGLNMAEATRLANVAAGLTVAKLGAASVTPVELRMAISRTMSEAPHGVLGEGELLDAVGHARSKGESIVMTNGCFDILHAGHVAYLRQAKRRGDRLIVAVNDDASVTKLKGDGRPVNALADRMAVLAALECVDWVVPFSEDTPERLICRVLPDVLVKGGDYEPEQIAGHGCVTKNGGKVEVLSFVPGASTTKIIDAIKRRPR
jgi:D-beta-D-heptose 7-phosphate kinase/D-beta-D-heptose 1-phosphate adenosyltransferase